MPEKLYTIENSESNVRVTVEKFHDNKWLLDQKNKVYEVIKKEGPLAEFMDKCLRVKKRISHENGKRVRTIELWGDGKILKNEWNIFWAKWAKELDNFENIKQEKSDLFQQILARMEDDFLQLQKKEEEAKKEAVLVEAAKFNATFKSIIDGGDGFFPVAVLLVNIEQDFVGRLRHIAVLQTEQNLFGPVHQAGVLVV